MTLYERLLAANLIDDYGLVTLIGQPHGSDNGVLFSTQYLVLCAKAGEGLDLNHVKVMNAIQACLNGGNPVRAPGNMQLNSPDNLLAMSASYKGNALAVYNYGWPLFNYNTPSPGKFTIDSWLGRQIGLIGFIQMVAGKIVNPIRLLALYVGIWLTSRNPLTETSDRLLAQLMIDTMPNTWYTRPLINWWHNTIRQQYANGINDCVKLYFGPSHVFSQVDWS